MARLVQLILRPAAAEPRARRLRPDKCHGRVPDRLGSTSIGWTGHHGDRRAARLRCLCAIVRMASSTTPGCQTASRSGSWNTGVEEHGPDGSRVCASSAGTCANICSCDGPAQLIEHDEAGRLPGRIGEAVVRTFDAPEALHTRFYEVHAKSALNKGARRGHAVGLDDQPVPRLHPCLRLLLRAPHPRVPLSSARGQGLRARDRGQGQRAGGAPRGARAAVVEG